MHPIIDTPFSATITEPALGTGEPWRPPDPDMELNWNFIGGTVSAVNDSGKAVGRLNTGGFLHADLARIDGRNE